MDKWTSLRKALAEVPELRHDLSGPRIRDFQRGAWISSERSTLEQQSRADTLRAAEALTLRQYALGTAAMTPSLQNS